MHRNDREKMFQSISKTAKLNMVANFFSSTLAAVQSKLERLTRQARQGQAL
jgi:hypothetical protein